MKPAGHLWRKIRKQKVPETFPRRYVVQRWKCLKCGSETNGDVKPAPGVWVTPASTGLQRSWTCEEMVALEIHES